MSEAFMFPINQSTTAADVQSTVISRAASASLPSTSKPINDCKASSVENKPKPKADEDTTSITSSSNYFQTLKRVYKSGVVTVYFLTTKCKKVYYAQLNERTFEMHDSQKAQRKRKSAKYIVDLSTCFNVFQQKFSKFHLCVSLMTPDETLLFKGKKDADTEEWFKMTMAAVIPARALRLGRPVFNTEFFECAWDVMIKANPKLQNPKADTEQLPNICVKRPGLTAEKQRLCIYPHSIVLCRFGIEARNEDGSGITKIPPFKTTDFIEFPQSYVKNFGFQEKYFFMRIGRSSDIGACEVWMQPITSVCEPDESAMDIYIKLKSIIDRENEKQRNGIIPIFGNIQSNKLTTRNSTHSITLPESSHRHSTQSNSSALLRLTHSRRNHHESNDHSVPSAIIERVNTENPTKPNKRCSTPTFLAPDNEKGKNYNYQQSRTTNSFSSSSNSPKHNINEKKIVKACERCGIDLISSSKDFDDLCCEYYAKASTLWEAPPPGAIEETEDSGGTLCLNYVPRIVNTSRICNSCSVNSLNNLVKEEKAEIEGEMCCNSCQSKDVFNESDLQEESVNRVKVFVECHAVEIDEKKETSYDRSFSINCESDLSSGGTTSDVDENKSLPSTSDENLNHTKTALVVGINHAASFLSISLEEEERHCAAKTLFSTDLTVTECSSENMSTSSLISTGGQLSCSFSTDGSGSNFNGYCAYPAFCADNSNARAQFYNTMPYHARTMSCSARCGTTGASTLIAETAAARAAFFQTQQHRGVIAEESFIVGGNLKSVNSITNQSSYSSTGNASFLAVPAQYDAQLLAGPTTEETCSYASDSGDSCYSSIANGNLNTRAFSFSCDTTQKSVNHCRNDKWCSRCVNISDADGVSEHHCCGTGVKPLAAQCQVQPEICIFSHHHCLHNHSVLPTSASTDSGAVTSLSINDESCIEKTIDCSHPVSKDHTKISNDLPSVKFLPQTTPAFTVTKSNLLSKMNEIEHLGSTTVSSFKTKLGQSDSRRRHVNRTSPKMFPVVDQSFLLQPQTSIEDLRRRTFSLGSASWITKRFRKLSFNNNANSLKNSTSKSGSSSLTTSVNEGTNYASMESIKLFSSSRQSSTGSFASSSVGTQLSSRFTRSESVDSNQSFLNHNKVGNAVDVFPSSSNFPSNKFLSKTSCKKLMEKAMLPLSDDLVEFECGQMYGANSSLSADQLTMIESSLLPPLTIFSANDNHLLRSESITSTANGDSISNSGQSAIVTGCRVTDKKILPFNLNRCAVSPSPSLATLSSSTTRDPDSLSHKTATSTRSSFCVTPSALMTGSSTGFSVSNANNNMKKFEMAPVIRPEKPTSISRKLREVPCFISQDDQAKLDQLSMMLNEKHSSKFLNNKIKGGGGNECSGSIGGGNVIFETIDENISGCLSRHSTNGTKLDHQHNGKDKKCFRNLKSLLPKSLSNPAAMSSDYVVVTCSPYRQAPSENYV